eukprot:CAMPEP_0196808426 /NCGR_PEP_ID=MMETSP1362-20130617/8410_1 /TAXON_ID=163516 /ORGANISM="Leptocylindrus danicus, Strain CCMP1856" /LENGTH=390 /DNA_ID=CAMNT_0042182765 /DNA_START=287 /DNA_END=1459 /DNA_ORIENTATION=+
MLRWLGRYDEGQMDQVLASMGVIRNPLVRPRASTATMVNDLVRDQLMGMGKEKVAQLHRKEIVVMANDFRTALGLERIRRSRGWASRQRIGAIKGMKDKDTVIISGTLVDMVNENWRGAMPDSRVDRNGLIVKDPLSYDEHHRLLSTTSKRRRFIAGQSDLDWSCSNYIDIREMGTGKMTINIHNTPKNVDIGRMPIESANHLRDLLRILYTTGKRSSGGVGFTKTDVSNTGNNRSKSVGLMSSFGYKDVGILYANSLADSVKEGNSSYSILGEIEDIIFDFLQSEYPDVLRDILADNRAKFEDGMPPYAVESGKFVSPRMIISSRLGNEAHIDFGDNGVAFVVWLAEDPTEDVDDWRFVMQNLRTDVDGSVRDTTTIQLFHGIVMVYDG